MPVQFFIDIYFPEDNAEYNGNSDKPKETLYVRRENAVTVMIQTVIMVRMTAATATGKTAGRTGMGTTGA